MAKPIPNGSAPQPAHTGGAQKAQEPRYQTRSIRDFKLRGKMVLMRLDLNVPLENTQDGARITDDSRITEALPTIQYAIEQGAKLILCSHLGRPEGKRNADFSLEPVAARLASLLNQEVTLAEDCVGEGIEMMAKNLPNGQVMLLENLRFYAAEESNDPEFSRRLAKLSEVYINDAFGTAHRKHASTFGVPSIVENKGMGLLIEKELKFLDQLINQPPAPFYAILGGSKVTDKINTINALLKKVQGVIIGGAMAHAFWAVKGIEIPKEAKQPRTADIEAAKLILRTAEARGIPIVIPVDTVGGFDIGPKTIELFCETLAHSKSVFWNGPLGWFEKEPYNKGTFEVAKYLALHSSLKVVGGGDTVSAIKLSGCATHFDHLSTGGGAVLEYLEQGGLPGIDILRSYKVEGITL